MKWENISVRQFYEILDILNEDYSGDEITQNADLIDCIWKVHSEDVSIVRFGAYLKELEFLQHPYKPKTPKKEYLVKGITFCPVLDVSKITTAQYIDFQELIKRGDKKNLLNVFFIKKGEEYGQSDNAELLWENLSLTDFADVQFFFLRLLNNLMMDTLLSSKKMLKKMYRKEKDPMKKEELMNQMATIKMALLELNDSEYLEYLQ